MPSFEKSPQRRIALHQDYASTHTALKTIEFLKQESIELVDYPPYSPDLSPNDSFTFPKVKNELRSQKFQPPEDAVSVFKNAILKVPVE